MNDLSPAAQAVLDATNQAYDQAATVAQGTAVALRAAVDAVAPEKPIGDIDYVQQNYVEGYMDALYEILIIVNELEAL